MSRREAYIKRTEQVNRQKCFLFTTFCVAFVIASIIISAKTYAGNKKVNNDSVKMYKSIMIYSGDSLESIADTYMTEEYASVNKYINEVASINGMSKETELIPGNKIIIPYYESNHQPSVIEFQLAYN